jgi:hypothetical protein
MGYKVDKFRLKKFYHYICKTYNFLSLVSGQKDFRQQSDVSIETIFLCVFLCLLLRWGSLRRIERELKRRQLKKFIPQQQRLTFCQNTIAYGLEHLDTDIQEAQLAEVVKQLKRNKAYRDTIGGLHIVALDGTEYFRSEAIHCDECLQYHIQTKDGIVTHYVHRAVMAQKVGCSLKPMMAVEKILPKDKQGDDNSGHEGELTAAKRLAHKVITLYGPGFVDVFASDALYTNYPFFSLVKKELSKDIVAKVKNEDSVIYQEIEALCTLTQPITGYDKEEGLVYHIYEIPSLNCSINWDIPLRGFKIIETKQTKKGVIENTFFCVTTLPKFQASADVIRQIVHAQWGIENNGFKDLKDNWFMEHNFHHHPNATVAVLLILFLAYNLFYAYLLRQMKTYRIYNLTQKEVVEEFLYSYIQQKRRVPFRLFSGP